MTDVCWNLSNVVNLGQPGLNKELDALQKAGLHAELGAKGDTK